MHGSGVTKVRPDTSRATACLNTRCMIMDVTKQLDRMFTKCRKVSDLNDRVAKKGNLLFPLRMADVGGDVKIDVTIPLRIDNENGFRMDVAV